MKVNGLSRAETWAQEITDAEGAVTKLPLEFMSICNNSVPAIKEITSQANDHEQDVLADTDVVASFKELLLNAMSSFAFTLEYTAGNSFCHQHDNCYTNFKQMTKDSIYTFLLMTLLNFSIAIINCFSKGRPFIRASLFSKD